MPTEEVKSAAVTEVFGPVRISRPLFEGGSSEAVLLYKL
jgi:hypothetical protein